MRYLLILLVFASCQPVARYKTLEPTEDTAEIKDCQIRLQECAEDNQVLQDSIASLVEYQKCVDSIMGKRTRKIILITKNK